MIAYASSSAACGLVSLCFAIAGQLTCASATREQAALFALGISCAVFAILFAAALVLLARWLAA